MTEITAIDILKSRQGFSEYIEKNSEQIINQITVDYPHRTIRVVYPQLTASSDGLLEIVRQLEGNIKAYIFWFIVNEKEDLTKIATTLNCNFDKNYCGIFIIKAFLNNDKIEFKTILKPEIPKMQKRNENAPAKLLQKEYWDKYFEVCDELQSQMQINPKAQHFQYIPMKKRGVQIMQTINTVNNYVATEIFINNDKEIFNKLLEHKNEIEEVLGYLDWQELEGKKSSRIRKTLNYNAGSEKALKQTITTHIKTAEEFKATFCKYL